MPDLDLGPAIEAGARAAYSAATFHTEPWDDLAPAARKTWLRESRTHIEGALPELEKALREKVAREIEAEADRWRTELAAAPRNLRHFARAAAIVRGQSGGGDGN